MHKIRSDLTKEEHTGWLAAINTANAVGDMPAVSGFMEPVLFQMMRGDVSVEDGLSLMLQHYGVTPEVCVCPDFQSYDDLYDAVSGTIRNCFGIFDKYLLDHITSDVFAVRMVGASSLDYSRIDRDFLIGLHRYLFQDVYPFAGKLRSYFVSRSVDFMEPGKIAGEMDAWCDLLGRSVGDRELSLDDMTGLWGRLDRIHCFCEGNGRLEYVLFDQVLHLSGFCLEIPYSGTIGFEMKNARACAASGQDGLLSILVSRGLK